MVEKDVLEFRVQLPIWWKFVAILTNFTAFFIIVWSTFIDTFFPKTLNLKSNALLQATLTLTLLNTEKISLLKTSMMNYLAMVSDHSYYNLHVKHHLLFSRIGGNLTISISDHFSQFSQLDIFDNIYIKTKAKYGRNWEIFHRNEFQQKLNRCCWDDVTSPNLNTNISFSNFYHKVEKLLDEIAPIKKMTRKEIGLPEQPWINHDILVARSVKSYFTPINVCNL